MNVNVTKIQRLSNGIVQFYNGLDIIDSFNITSSVSIGSENNVAKTIVFSNSVKTLSFNVFNIIALYGSASNKIYSAGIDPSDTSEAYVNRLYDIYGFLISDVIQGCCPGPTFVGGVVAVYPNFASFPATGQQSVIYIDESTNQAYFWDGSSYQLLTSTGVETYPNFASFPATGMANIIYVDLSVPESYVWDGSVYVSLDGGSVAWGSIIGTLSAQTDLQTALNAKFDDPTGTTAEYIRGDGSLATFPTIPGGTVTAVTATAPMSSTGGATPNLSMSSANGTTNGYLLSSDWLIFNGKFNTPTGTTLQYLRGDGSLATFPVIPAQYNPTAGTGISITGAYPNQTITNTAPDQVVALTAGTGIGVAGTYPNFTISNSDPTSGVTLSSAGGTESLVNDGTGPSLATKGLTAGTGISLSGTTTAVTVTNSAPDQTVALTAGTGIGVTGTYPNFTITNSSPSSGGTVTSVGLTMPSAFSVASSPVTTSGTLAVTGAGTVSQYVRGDGSLANFPSSTGGGSSLSYYLNGSVSQGTFGGVAMKEMDRTPVLGAGTDFTIATNGYIQSFITDANVPNQLEIPAGNWNFETYFSASSSGGTPSFYIELYKWDGATLSLIASNSATPEGITNGTVTDAYFSALAVPQTTLALTDRLAVRIWVNNSGRTIKLHTENSHLCQVITTFSTGLTALNGLTAQVQNFATGTSGTDFGISSATSTHTFNLPTASAANRGALSSADWTTFNSKVPSTRTLTINGTTQDLSADRTFTISSTNIYNTDGSLTGARTLTLNSNPLTIAGTSSTRFHANGNVGIGTTIDAGYKLDVVGSDARINEITVGRGGGSGAGNTAIGKNALPSNLIGIGNTAVGNNALALNQGTGNTAVGNGALLDNVTGVANTAVGVTALSSNTANNNTAVGGYALYVNTTGGQNTAIGTNASESNTTGINNVAIGYIALASNTTTSQNVAVGHSSLRNNIAGSNTALGFGAGYNGGTNANTTGTNNIFIGTNAIGVSATDSNRTWIGNASTATTWLGGNVLIGTTSSAASAILQADSTTKGFLPPRMTTTEKNAIASPATGLVVYDTTLNALNFYNGTAWSSGGGGGTVTSVAALTLGTTGTDLTSTVANGTTTPVITLNVPTASATNRGALSSTDWNTFNNKQNTLSLTTTGTSGPATLVGATLNIPQYSGGGGGVSAGDAIAYAIALG